MGAGQVGCEVAHITAALGMDVLVHDPYVDAGFPIASSRVLTRARRRTRAITRTVTKALEIVVRLVSPGTQ
jgi:hypothetical protein